MANTVVASAVVAAHVRPGAPRSESARLAILTAASAQFAEKGYDHFTVEGTAAAAGVGKQTIYRWWPSKSALIAECLLEGLVIDVWFVPPDSGDFRADMTLWLENVLAYLRDGHTDLLRYLVIAGAENEAVATQLSERLGVFEMLGERMQSAIANSQLSATAPAEEIGEALLGALVVRTLRRGDLGPEFAARLVDTILPPVVE